MISYMFCGTMVVCRCSVTFRDILSLWKKKKKNAFECSGLLQTHSMIRSVCYLMEIYATIGKSNRSIAKYYCRCFVTMDMPLLHIYIFCGVDS